MIYWKTKLSNRLHFLVPSIMSESWVPGYIWVSTVAQTSWTRHTSKLRVSNQLTVKIARVFLILHVWYKLRLLSQQAVPVKTLKEDVFLHLLNADGAKTFQWVVLKKTKNKILGIIRWTVLSLVRPLYTLCPLNYTKHNLRPNSTIPTFPWRLWQVRDKPVMSHLAQIPLRRLPKLPHKGKFRGSWRNGIWAKWDITGLLQTSQGSWYSGMRALHYVSFLFWFIY